MRNFVTNVCMYGKFIIFKIILEVILFFIGLFLYWLAYLFRNQIDNNPTLFKWLLLYWLVNSDEDNPIDNWYGVYEILDGDYKRFHRMNWFQKFLLSYQWGIRNFTWNLRLALGRGLVPEHTTEVFNVPPCKILKFEGDSNYYTWRNKTIFGVQSIYFPINNTKHFRYSFTRPLRKWSPCKLFGYKNINFMWGSDKARYLWKLRVFK